ncbi:MAG TPA: SDR family oxidoreductase [Thermoanaerobaculia bacterium]|nr:SDR family oxidoreductase [Thermoanaerobaculia bacterium]
MTPRHALVIAPHGAVGNAVAGELRRRGARVTGAGRTPPDPGVVDSFLPLDLASADWPRLLAEASGDGPLDAIVYAAGSGAFGLAGSIPEDQGRAVFEINFWALTEAARAAAARWTRDGTPGTFLAVLSIAGRRAVPFESYYGASKAAALRFLEVLDLETPESIRFVAAAPGLIRSPFRSRAAWHGMAEPPATGGASPGETAVALCALLEGSRESRVIGWRERAIDLADRFAPGLYDRLVLRPRIARGHRP